MKAFIGIMRETDSYMADVTHNQMMRSDPINMPVVPLKLPLHYVQNETVGVVRQSGVPRSQERRRKERVVSRSIITPGHSTGRVHTHTHIYSINLDAEGKCRLSRCIVGGDLHVQSLSRVPQILSHEDGALLADEESCRVAVAGH
jgi:hypothetical protein